LDAEEDTDDDDEEKSSLDGVRSPGELSDGEFDAEWEPVQHEVQELAPPEAEDDDASSEPVARVQYSKQNKQQKGVDDMAETTFVEAKRQPPKLSKMKRPKHTSLDVVLAETKRIVNEYADELENDGKGRFVSFLHNFTEEMENEFHVYKNIALEYGSHVKFSRDLNKEIKANQSELVILKKQNIEAERAIAEEITMLEKLREAKETMKAAESYLAQFS